MSPPTPQAAHAAPHRVPNGSTATTTVADSVSSRLAKSQSVIENLQRNLVTKLSPTTIESLKSKYAATPAPLARPDPGLDLDLGPDHPSPFLPAKSGVEVKQQAKKQPNGKPAAVFDVSNVEGQSSVKLAFLSGLPVKAAPRAVPSAVPSSPKKAVERKPLHGPWARKVVDKPAPSNKPPVPTKKDVLVVKQEVVAKKKSPVRSPRKDAPQDGLSELLKNLVTGTTRRSDSDTGTAADTTASKPRPPKPQPAPRTTSLPPSTDTPPPSGRPSRELAASPASPSPRPSSLSPTRPSPATSPGRTPPERSQLLEERLNEIRKDLWEEEPDPAASAPPPGRLRHDGVTPTSPPPRSVQEATLEHYARAIQRHLDGQGGVPAAPRLSELHVDTSSSTHSSTSTLVSTPSQLSPGWASSEPRAPRGRRLTDSDASRATSPQKKRLRDELLGFYYRSLEREARRPPAPGRSGRLSAPPLQLPVVIPTDQATRTPDRTLRQEFIVVRDSDATYQNLQSLRRPPGSPLLASGEDSDSTTQDYRPRPRSNMNFFVRGGPQRNTIGSYPTRKTPPRDEVDLRREFGDVELRHPERLALAGLKKRHNSESGAAEADVPVRTGKNSNAWVSPKDAKDAKKSAKANGGKKSLFPIFRKGSLHPSQPASPSTPPPTLPKRVSFSSATSPISDSVFLPNSPSYYANGHGNGYAEQIYANQYTVSPGEGTYVNYTMPTPPDLNGISRAASLSQQQPASQGVYGTTPQPTSGVYGSTKQTSNGVYGSTKQTSNGVYGSTKLTSNGVYGSTKPTSNGVYGSTQQPNSGVYGVALQSPTVVYGTRQQPGPSPSNQGSQGNQASPGAGAYNPALPSPTSTYGSTQPSPASEYGPTVFANTAFGNGVYGTRQQASPSPFAAQQRTPTSDAALYGSASSPSTPYATRPPNGASPGSAYSPSQPPSGPGFGSSPNTAPPRP
ncbi:nascent polypeptide-associated complex subunit alpha, muscle-specific form-like [Thrips palmi]|uniref:Nascent polypeptide-associated complex subunit alpha, muscle-specific form-like n=1 Tax=Thrips palmi TaxID=161013 RepID=A0A6P8ZL09_THRPL|nr:nascent polypeptide-associated complex subunit alpha, muscle-specific form-like [Thrips palmi]